MSNKIGHIMIIYFDTNSLQEKGNLAVALMYSIRSFVFILSHFGCITANVPLIRDVAGTGTEFSRQDRKCFENRTPGKQKTSNDCG
jgi:hypothetical protein